MRRFLIISFDGLDYDLVEMFNMVGLKQAEYGRVDLSPVFERGGHDYPLTDQLYSTFISGKLPDEHHVKSWLSMRTLQEQNIPTLFNLPNSLGINVPVWSYNTMRQKFLNSVKRYIKIPNQDLIPLEEELFNYESGLMFEMLESPRFPIWRKWLLMTYFVFSDLLGHVYGDNLNHLHNMYVECEALAINIKERFNYKGPDTMLYGDEEFPKDFDVTDNYLPSWKVTGSEEEEPITLIFGDHGMKEGVHTDSGFYSLSEPLGWKGIKINEFYDKIRSVAYGPKI